jgi:hypothetical protein
MPCEIIVREDISKERSILLIVREVSIFKGPARQGLLVREIKHYSMFPG